MIGFLRSRKSAIVCALVAVGLSMFSCTKVDYTLGDNFIPDREKMKMAIDTIHNINTYTRTVDSIDTDRWSFTYLGSYVNSYYGRTTSSYVTEYSPGTFESRDSLYGTNPVIDSVIMYLSIDGIYGDTTLGSPVSVYPLIKNLQTSIDSSFYSNFDPSSYVDKSVGPIATFNLKGRSTIGVRLPESFYKNWVDTTGQVYRDDSLFRDKYKGLYFEAPEVNAGGSLYRFSKSSSYMLVYYKSETDTSYVKFLFSSEMTTNKSFTMIDHNFSYADPIVGVKPSVINDMDNPQSQSYVYGLAGLMSEVHMMKDDLEQIRKKAEAQGYKHVVINNAELTLNLNNPSIDLLNISAPRLGIYYDYQAPKFMPDYRPGAQNFDKAPFDGYLNRAKMSYTMNITSYIQQLYTGVTDKYVTQIATAEGYQMYPVGVFLNSTKSTKPVSLAVTYTMVK